MPSSILFIIICSNGKTRLGEVDQYQPQGPTIGEHLPECVPLLFKARNDIRTLIATSDEAGRDGKLLRTFPFNDHLIKGPDFQRGLSRGGQYLPAANRYHGRYYVGIGANGSPLLDTPHHVLIVSGLYGLLTPSEPIQCYSCHVLDHPKIPRTWREDDLLTGILVAYIKKFNVARVFEFMADDTYRSLIAWEMVRHATNGNVLHCFSRQFAGPALLPSLAILSRKLLCAPPEILLSKKAGDSEQISEYADEVIFQPSPIPDLPDLAQEVKIKQQTVRLEVADKIGRMRRNINRMLDSALGSNVSYFGFGQRVASLRNRGRLRDREIAGLMQDFSRIRNPVEYEGLIISETDDKWKRLRSNYAKIEAWADGMKYTASMKLEEIDF
jgi:hypothetical protein